MCHVSDHIRSLLFPRATVGLPLYLRGEVPAGLGAGAGGQRARARPQQQLDAPQLPARAGVVVGGAAARVPVVHAAGLGAAPTPAAVPLSRAPVYFLQRITVATR